MLAIVAWTCSAFLYAAAVLPLVGVSRSEDDMPMLLAGLLVFILLIVATRRSVASYLELAPKQVSNSWRRSLDVVSVSTLVFTVALLGAFLFSLSSGRGDPRLTLGFFALAYFFLGRFLLLKPRRAKQFRTRTLR